MKDLIAFAASSATITTGTINNQIELFYATLRLLMNNDREIRALRKSHNTNRVRLDRIEKALSNRGIE